MKQIPWRLLPSMLAGLVFAFPPAAIAQDAPKLAPLQPKPGHVIGRIVDTAARPITNVEIQLVGTLNTLTFEPDVHSRTGYYEIEVPDDLYRIHASFNEATNRMRPQTVECLLNSLDEFVSLDGKGKNTRSASKRGIVKDFVYVPRGC
jgi:hypothetical protein